MPDWWDDPFSTTSSSSSSGKGQSLLQTLKKKQEIDRHFFSSLKWCELKGKPFGILNESEKWALLHSFRNLLESPPCGVLYVRSEPLRYRVGGEVKVMRTLRFFLGTQERIPVTAFDSVLLEESPLSNRPEVVLEEKGKILRLSNGQYVAPLVFSGTTGDTLVAYIYGIRQLLHEFFLVWVNYGSNSYQEALSLRMCYPFYRLSQAKQASAYRKVLERAMNGYAVLDVWAVLFVKGSDPDNLKSNISAAVNFLRETGVNYVEPLSAARALYELDFENYLKPMFTDSLTAATCFPLIAEEILDPGGVYLGTSQTNRPVVLNVYAKRNPMFVILGDSGSGKSTTAKAFLSRMRQEYDLPVYGIDPEGEYTNETATRMIGFERVHNIREGEKMGLDPFMQLRVGAIPEVTLADLLITLYGIPPNKQAALRRYVGIAVEKGVGSIYEFYEEVLEDETLREYMASIYAAPDKYVYTGNPPDLSRPVVFSLRFLQDRTKQMVSALMTTYAFRKLYRDERRKLFFVDEAWLFTKLPSVMSLLGEISRRGRKRGVALVLATQRVEDLAKTDEGRSVLEQASTKLILGHKPESGDVLRSVFKLTADEVEYVTGPLNKGEGLLISDGVHCRVSVVLSSEELKAFKTESTW